MYHEASCSREFLRFSWSSATPVALHSSAAQVPAPPMQPSQPRDAAPTAKGTGAISGRVTNLETGGPLQRAVIRITSSALPSDRRVSTNSDGRYEVRELPAGAYSLKAERGGYLTLAYGQRRTGEVGKPLQLGDGQTVKAIDFALPRMGVISGRVVDDTGEPIAKVVVYAMQFGRHQGARRLIPFVVPEECCWRGGHSVTDDSGQYSPRAPARRVRGHGTEPRDVAARVGYDAGVRLPGRRFIRELSSQPKRSA